MLIRLSPCRPSEPSTVLEGGAGDGVGRGTRCEPVCQRETPSSTPPTHAASSNSNPLAEEDSLTIPDISIIESSAELLYGLVHQRFILTKVGMQEMVRPAFSLANVVSA
jgi:hypothetical protein